MLNLPRRWKTLLILLLVLYSAGVKCPGGEHSTSVQAGTPSSLPPPSALRDHIADGKLRLSLEDAIRLAVLNNTDVRLARTPLDQARWSMLAAYHPFDPLLTSSLLDQRQFIPATSALQGASTVNLLTQQAIVGYTQTFETGTNINTSFAAGKFDTNSGFYFINPELSSSLSFTVTQPLLKNRGSFPNLAPIRIAQRNLNASEATFEAQVSNSIQQAIVQYWNVVLARESLRVAQESLKQAQASYEHDKRALDLGALPPLDIYRSESQVAQRRVAEIQGEYLLKQNEDQFRQVIGADLDPFVQALDLDLVQDPRPEEPLFTIDVSTALTEARQHRPEFRALNEQLAGDDLNIRLSQNQLLPDLELQGLYTSSGVGGNQYDITATPPVLVAPGGFGDALSQVFHFGSPTYIAQLTLNLPIHNRAARAALGQARVSKTNDLYLARRQDQTVKLDVVNAVHSLEEAKLSIAAAQIARDLAQKTVESEQRKLELGAEQTYFVLEAQTELAQAEVDLVQAQVGYQVALAAVDHATGALLDRHEVQVEAVGQRP